MLELNREVKNLYHAYYIKSFKPETVLEIASDFVLDLINVFGDNLDQSTPLKPNWKQFAPFEFILELNNILAKYKQSGHAALDANERSLLSSPSVLLGSLVSAALKSHPDSFPNEEHFQIPDAVARELLVLSEFS